LCQTLRRCCHAWIIIESALKGFLGSNGKRLSVRLVYDLIGW